MVEVLDTKTFSITVITHGAAIENLIYPTQVEVPVAFDVTYDCRNTGNTSEEFSGSLTGNGEIVSGSEWQEPIDAGTFVSKVVNLTIDEDTDFVLEVRRP